MKIKTLFVFACFVVAACGSGAPEGSTLPAVDPDTGRHVTTGGEAVSEQAHNAWRAGLGAFHAAETSGWNESRCEDVRDKFDDAIEAQHTFAEALYMAGLVRQRCGHGDEALAFFNRALEADQTLCAARAAVGVAHYEAGRMAEARGSFERAVHDDPQCTEGYVNLAMMQRAANDGAEALNNLRRALAIEARYLPAFNQMALLYLDEAAQNPQKLDLASVVCSQAQKIDRNYAPIYNTWGLINLKKGNLIEALAMFERAFTLDSKIFEAHMNFGQITLSFRGYEDAQRACGKAVELQPRNYDAHVCFGAALRGLRRLDDAQAQYRAAIEIDGNRAEAYFNLGLIHQEYMSGSPEDLRHADEFYQQFLGKAGQQTRYRTTVEEVSRRCNIERQQRAHRRRRARSTDCRPGRRQNIELSIQGLAEAAAMQAEAQRLMEQQQQQQQQENQQANPPPDPAPKSRL